MRLPSFLLGSVDSADRIGSQELRLFNTAISSYIQDDIKFNPKLTVNVGVRWDIFGAVSGEEQQHCLL